MREKSIFWVKMACFAVWLSACGTSGATSLVGAWTFGNYSDTSGNTLDSSGVLPVLNGTLQNGAILVKDSTQRGWVLKPNGGGCLLGYDHKLYAPKSITVQYWHKKSTASENWKYMVGQDGNGPRHFNNGGGMIYCMQTSDSGWNPINVGGTSNTQWRHFVATYDGEYLYGYINGVQVAKIYRGGTINTQNNYWSIGRQWNGMASGAWAADTTTTGWIDDVAIWNGYAPPAVVLGLYNGTYTIYNAPIEEPDYLGDYPEGDLNRDGFVNTKDMEIMAGLWLEDCTLTDCGRADMVKDNKINIQDFSKVSAKWLYNTNTGPVMSIENLMGIPTFKVNNAFTTAAVFSHNWPHPDYVPVKQFADTGTIIQDFGGSNLNEWWLRTNPDKWDYSTIDTRINFLIQPTTGDPDVLLMPWVTVTPPQWWLDDPANANELEMADSGSGPAVVQSDGKKYPSLASPKWRQDMAYALENYIDYLYLTGRMLNIAGFKLSDVGCGGENLWRYSWWQNPGGYGLRTKEGFRQWLRDKYNNDIDALEAAWNNTAINSFDNVQVPTYSERKAYEGTRTFRNPGVSMNVIDWELFWNELLVDTLDYFAGVIKNKTNGTKLVGGFYCYMYEWCGNPEDGHQALRKYNQSKNLDFIWQTASYETRGYITGGDVLRGPGYSNILHGKQWANSNDTATFVCGYLDANDKIRLGYTDTVERNKRMFLRSAGFNICNGGFLQEFFALHDQWYHDPSNANPYILVTDAVTDLNFIYGNSKNYDRRSNSEVLIVSDEVSCSYVTYKWDNPVLKTSLRTPQIALTQMGTPNDQILLDDIALLPNPDQYKLIIFLNCYNMTDAQRAMVDSLKGNNRVLVFCYAAGYFNGGTYSEANMESLLGGMDMVVDSAESFISPRMAVARNHPLGQAIWAKGITAFGPNESICKRIYANVSTSDLIAYDPLAILNGAMAIRDNGTWQAIYAVSADMPASVYREIARYAGVHIYDETNETFYANRSYVCIHPNHDEGTQQSRTINFPAAVNIYDAQTETLLQSNTTSYTSSYYGGQTKVYRYVPVP